MAIKSVKKGIKESTIADVDSKNNGTHYRAALFKVSPDGTILKNETGIFMLNPSSYEENKNSNWNQQIVPGQSDPVLQWSASGARTLSFEALVTADTSNFDSAIVIKPGEETDPVKKTLTAIGQIASAFFNITVPPPRTTIEEKTNKGDSLDITNYLNYYRSLLYPEYGKNYTPSQLSKTVTQSPPLVVLYSGSSINKLALGSKITNVHDVWVITDLKIRITKQLPNLAPMEASVQFSLLQYNIRSFDSRRFTKS